MAQTTIEQFATELKMQAGALLEQLGTGPTTRASLAVYNTHEEVAQLLSGVAHAIEVLR